MLLLKVNTFVSTMRHWIIFHLLFFSILHSHAQDESAPFRKNPMLPDFSILREDSTSWITPKSLRQGSPTIVMLFSPDCDHCREQTEILTDNITKLKNVDIVMTTFQPIKKIRDFCREFELHQYSNIFIGRDVKYFFAPFFRIKYAPFIAVYGRDRKLVRTFEGDTEIDMLLNALK